jgi:hypothetical protein
VRGRQIDRPVLQVDDDPVERARQDLHDLHGRDGRDRAEGRPAGAPHSLRSRFRDGGAASGGSVISVSYHGAFSA